MKKIFIFMFLILSTLSGAVVAQDVNGLNEISEKIITIKNNVSKSDADSSQNVDGVSELSTYSSTLRKIRGEESALLSSIEKQVQALGDAPAEGETEAPEIASQRADFTIDINTHKKRIATIDLALTNVDDIHQIILQQRNKQLFNQITAKKPSVFDMSYMWKSVVAFTAFLTDIIALPAIWITNLTSEQLSIMGQQLFTLAIWLIVFLGVSVALSWFIRTKYGYKADINKPTYMQKLVAGFFVLVAKGVAPAILIGAFIVWLSNHAVLFSGNFGTFLTVLSYYLLYILLFSATISVLFTPKFPHWRLINISSNKVAAISSTLMFTFILMAFASFMQTVGLKLGYGDETLYMLKMINNGVKAFCVMLISYRLLYDNTTLTDEEADGDEINGLSKSSKISIVVSALSVLIFAFSLFGYTRLSEFIFNRVFLTIICVGLFFMLQKLTMSVFERVMELKFWVRSLHISKKKIKKIEVWFSLITTVFSYLFTIFFSLAIWGLPISVMLRSIRKFLTGFYIGDMHISITSLILGVIAFFITMSLIKFLKNSLTHGALTKIEMDEGIRNSLVSGLGFFGIIAAIFVSISVMGGSFKGLAIIAGALSFGAGLGLQNVVNNFVSGLILLFERPVKIGDWVVINDLEGIITKISMRSTHLETFTKANIIIPNADLLSNSLINLTYQDKNARIDIPVGVAYDSDVELVKSTLIDIAKNTKDTLKTPEPFIMFLGLGASSLDFRLCCFTSNVSIKHRIQTDILSEIIARFRELNIEIPFPQQVVHLSKDENTIKVENKSDK